LVMAFSLLGWALFGDKTLCHDRLFGNHSFLQNFLHITRISSDWATPVACFW